MKEDKFHDYCKCGNLKYIRSKKCAKCFQKNTHKGQVSRTVNRWKHLKKSKLILEQEIII